MCSCWIILKQSKTKPAAMSAFSMPIANILLILQQIFGFGYGKQ